MSTYLPNVKDYIPEVKAYTPDFKFLSDSLDSRQDRYNNTTKALNNLYGEVVHAGLSREDNKSIREAYAEQIAPKIQQISGLDFSLAQNVQAAKGLFKPFYEDDMIVRDIVFTRAYQDQMKLANMYKNAATSEERKRYWEDGVKFMNYQMQDFQNKTREESMGLQLPEFHENPNLYQRGLESLYSGGPDGKGLKVTETFIDQTGQFIVTQENGVTLTSKPTGKMVPNPEFNPEKKESRTNPKEIPGMYNPAGQRVKNAVLNDPVVTQGLRIKAYVEARDWYETQAKESGQPIDVFKRQWATQEIEKYQKLIGETLITEKEELNKVNRSLASWETYTKNTPLIAGSEEYLQWFMDVTSSETIQAGIDELETHSKNVLGELDPEDLDAFMNRGYAAYISNYVGEEIFNVAKQYSDETFKKTFKESQIHLEKLRHRNNVSLANTKRIWALQDKVNERLEAINAASNAPHAIPGDLENTMHYGSLVERNESAELDKELEKRKLKIKGIMSFYSFLADGINTDINLQNMADLRLTDENRNSGEVSTAGIFIPNTDANTLQFYRWENAYEPLMNNPELLNHHYTYLMNVHNNQDLLSSYKNPENELLRKTIGNLEFDITTIDTKLKIIKDKQKEVYKNVLTDIGDLGNIDWEVKERMKKWDLNLFDDNGYIMTTEDLYNKELKKIVSEFEETIPKYLPSKNEIASKWSDGNNNWITTDQDPNSPITPQALQQRINEAGAHVGPYMAAYFGLVENNPLGEDGQTFMNKWYSSQNKPWVSIPIDQKIPLMVKPGSTIEDVYTDIATDHLDFGTYREVIDKVKNEMNNIMESELAINGVTTFDFNSYWHGTGEVGDMAFAPVIPFRYDAGTLDRYVKNELDFFYNALDNLPNNQIIPMTGNQGNAFTALVDAADQKLAYSILNQIRADRNWKPGGGAETSGTPGYRLEYSSVGGGEGGEGNYAMYKFILDSDYATKLAKNLPAITEGGKNIIQDNTITIFFNKDLFSNPLDPEQQYKSVVKTMITMPGNQGRATINTANGGIIHFEMNAGLVTQKYAQYTYNTLTGNMELGNFSPPQALIDNDPNSRSYGLPITDYNVDAWYAKQRLLLEDLAETNLLAQRQHKLKQSNSSDEEELEVTVNNQPQILETE